MITDGSVPHFDLPFRVNRGKVRVVEQDTYDDIFNCVHMAFKYFQGERLMIPTFGIPDMTFDLQPLDLKFMIAEVEHHEPRASLLMSQTVEELVARVMAEVRT